MAEGVLMPVFTNLLSNLVSTGLGEIALICGVKEEIAKLKDTLSAMEAVLLDAEERGDQDHAIKDWLGKLKDAAYDADDLLDELSYETMRREAISRDKHAKKVRLFFSKHNQFFVGSKMAHKIKKLRQRLEVIAADRTQFHFIERMGDPSRTKEREYSHGFVREEEVIGRDEEKEEVVKCLLEINEKQNVSVHAIVGLGGMGKTMLALSVFNYGRVTDAFDLRLWVCISEKFDLKVIVEKIIESSTNERTSVREMDSLQRRLRILVDGKKYLLVMDDLWNEDGERWASLMRLLMDGAKGSKILITTRSKLVAEVSGETSPYILNGLSESNSWILFKQMAFRNSGEAGSPNMIEIGKEIAKACFGAPLVIRTIGRLLYLKTSEAEWLSFKNNDLGTITQQENGITHALKLSYNHLPSYLKPCFAYCALFLEDHLFEKDELIKMWVAEGFVQSQGENKCLEDIGHEYFMELIWRSIFQDVKRNEYGDVVGCKMHDLMHDLARLVAGKECFTPDSDIKNVNQRTRRILFYRSSSDKWCVISTSQLKLYKVRTFLSSYSAAWKLKEVELEDHMSSLKSLRVLDLQQLRWKVPFSIGTQKHLRFLNLSLNNEIESLPSSITKLHNLQTLNIFNCSSLEELPKDIGSLINLRHLDISYNWRIELLPSSVTKLKFLQTLNLTGCSILRKLPEDIGSLINLRCLRLSDNSCIQRIPDSTSNLLHLQILTLAGCRKLIELPENIGNMVDLRFLHLHGDWGLKLLPNSIAKLQKLQCLSLNYCTSLTELPSDVSNLVNLHHLYLARCDGLRSMSVGLNKLTALQTLNLFAVGTSVSAENSGLWQLNTLINLKGSLLIRNLHHLRKDASRANTVDLKGIHGVRHLSFEWSEIGYNPKGIDPDFVVLEKLHPNKNVETLRIGGYSAERLSSWVSSLSNLKDITMESCERLQYLSRFDQLPLLQNFEFSRSSLIEYVDNNETPNESGSSVFFPSLQSLTLFGLDKLKGWWKPREFATKEPSQSSFLPSFHCLAYFNIRGCNQLFSIPFPNLSSTTMSLNYSASEPIRSASREEDPVHSEIVPNLVTLPEGLQHLTAMQSLKIVNCKALLVLPDWIGDLTSLQNLEIIDCPKLTSLPEIFRQLSSLRSLTIKDCCRRLEERCARETGEDWSKIAHVEYIKVGR